MVHYNEIYYCSYTVQLYSYKEFAKKTGGQSKSQDLGSLSRDPNSGLLLNCSTSLRHLYCYLLFTFVCLCVYVYLTSDRSRSFQADGRFLMLLPWPGAGESPSAGPGDVWPPGESRRRTSGSSCTW